MIRRLLTLAILAAAAIGGPYVATETEVGRDTMSSIKTTLGDNGDYLTSVSVSSADTEGYANHAHHAVEKIRRANTDRYQYDQQVVERLGGGNPDEAKAAPRLVGTPIKDLREVMRFDITPNWVIQRFTRVTTVLADLQLEGLRVPIVTGTQPDDLAGTLTYYFDASDKLQRVSIHAFTGDPNRLIGAMTQHYGLIREPSLEAGVFTKRWNGKPVHFLRLSHAPIVYSDALHHKYTVFLELNDPNLAYGISHEARRIVQSDRMTGRW